MTEMFQGLNLTTPISTLSVGTVVVNLLVATVIGALITVHFVRFGRTYTNRDQLAGVFPLLVLSISLAVSVIETAAALAVGLFAIFMALRFRTPIKEPEELAYIFLCVATGVGIGAGHLLATSIGFVLIMTLVTIRSLGRGHVNRRGLLWINVDVPTPAAGAPDPMERVSRVVEEAVRVKVVRGRQDHEGRRQATFGVECHDVDRLTGLVDSLRGAVEGIEFSVFERNPEMAGRR